MLVSEISCKSDGSVPGGWTGVVETMFAKLGACSRQYVVRPDRSELQLSCLRSDTVIYEHINSSYLLTYSGDLFV